MTFEPKPLFDLGRMRIAHTVRETAVRVTAPKSTESLDKAPGASSRAGSVAEVVSSKPVKILVSQQLAQKLVSEVTPALHNLLQILKENHIVVLRGHYHNYMQSDQWMLKSRAMRDYFKTCAVCNSDKHLQVHHKHYETLGHERLEDLTVLCGDCHWAYEKQQKEEKENQKARKPIMKNTNI